MKLVDVDSVAFQNAIAAFVYDSQYGYIALDNYLKELEADYDVSAVLDVLECQSCRMISTRKAASIIRSGGKAVSCTTPLDCRGEYA